MNKGKRLSQNLNEKHALLKAAAIDYVHQHDAIDYSAEGITRTVRLLKTFTDAACAYAAAREAFADYYNPPTNIPPPSGEGTTD